MTDTNTDPNHGLGIDVDAVLDAFHVRLLSDRSESTADSYRRHARDYLRWVAEMVETTAIGGPFDVEPPEVKTHLREMLNDGYAPGSVRIRRSAICKFYDECRAIATDRTDRALAGLDAEEIGENPADSERMKMDFSELKKGSRRSQELKDDYTALEPAEIEDLIEHVPAPRLRNELLVRLAYVTGVRVSELTRIKLSDFGDVDDLRGDRSINIRAMKTSDNRTVYYTPTVARLLEEWIHSHRPAVPFSDDSPYLFVTAEGERIKEGTVNLIVKSSAEDAGLQAEVYEDMNGNSQWRITSHVLRHSFARSCLENGMDLRTLAELMGHYQQDGTPAIETTSMYLKGVDTEQEYKKHGPGAGSGE